MYRQVERDPQAGHLTLEAAEGLTEEGNDPSEIVEAQECQSDLEKALKKLPEIQRCVIVLRYGYGDDDPLTVEEVAKHLNLTTEGVVKNEADGLCNLHNALGSWG